MDVQSLQSSHAQELAELRVRSLEVQEQQRGRSEAVVSTLSAIYHIKI